ncbi:MAG: trehalose-6-phosphate synthase [Thermomicrobiales bacterium]|nr:trehalose-6-phosphate synthase [Thermomicrobiales bacterium]
MTGRDSSTVSNSSGPASQNPDAPRPLIIASNRGPVTFSRRTGGSFDARKGSGGVVTAVSAVARERQPIWIAAAMTDGDRQRAAFAKEDGEHLIEFGDPAEFRLRFVVPTPEAYHQYYNVISNPLLWFLQHYLWDTPRSPDITHDIWDAWRNGYVSVNRQFADEIIAAIDAVDGDPLVMLQDYHLYLCAGFIREKRPNAHLQLFIHIPWPDPDYWRLLPMEMRRAICEGALGNDIVGFQTPDHGRSFMYTCQAYVPDVEIDYQNSRIHWRGREIQVRAYPISIDSEAVRRLAYSKDARSHDRYLPNHWNEFTILRVDRAEPSKNIVRGFQAFDRFLESHREFQGRVNFVAITVPSRMDVVEYQDYLDDVSAVVGRINAKYANVETGWQPIHLIMGENYPRALAAMKWYDVLLVNSIIDGMNLVAKEGALLNERNGVLILSEGAGAVHQLREHSILIAPTDVEGTAEAMFQALTMPLAERRRRAEGLRKQVEGDDVATWFENQVNDIQRLIRRQSEPVADDDESLPPNIVPLTGPERATPTGS